MGMHFCVLPSAIFSPFQGVYMVELAAYSQLTRITFHMFTQTSSLRTCAMSSDLRSGMAYGDMEQISVFVRSCW